MSGLYIIFFWGGWLPLLNFNLIPNEFWFSFKITIVAFLFVFIRANYPRIRYDQLMTFGWKIFLPLTFGYLLLISSLLITFNGLPYSINLFYYN